MANEAHDPWALLREARESVLNLAYEYEYLRFSVQLVQEQRDLASRIDAALAAHEAEERVEWESGTDYEGKTFASAQVKDIAIEVNGWDRAGTRFYWRIFSTLDEEGHANTLDEAQRAALSAARGMR